jgi:hypothetical protein
MFVDRYGFNVKSGRGRGGEVRDVLFAHNIVALAISEVMLLSTTKKSPF